jgi:sugar phosphate isomerase/epimerase
MTLKLGTTLYSLTNEFHGLQYTFEELVAEVARRGIGPGLEVVGFQSIRGFPVVTRQFEHAFKALIDRHELVPSCLGINADVAIRRDRQMSVDESVLYHEAQIAAAAQLGFPVVRCQFPAGPEVMRRLVPFAEKHRVKLGLEIHAPATLTSDHTLPFREMYAQVNSPFLGFVPDFGTTARAIPPTVINSYLQDGIAFDAIELALSFWGAEGEVGERMQGFEDAARSAGLSEQIVVQLSLMFVLFGRLAPEAWAEIMPQVVHIHGKFFDFDENGSEIAVDYPRVLKVFLDAGYDGYMSSEYEGHIFSDEGAFAKLEKHHALCRSLIDGHGHA